MEYLVWAVNGDKPAYFEPWENKGAKATHNFREGAICSGNERQDHPAQKPLWVVEDFLLRHSIEGFRVFDPFAGVGTVLVACKKHKRMCLGFEKDKEYVSIAKDRLAVTK
jgi:DNA modification methylase